MRRIVFLLLFNICFIFSTYSQNSRLGIFINCSNTRCHGSYFRTDITSVDHLNDRVASDVHILITSNRNASQGRTYQTIFYGQNDFSHITDTLVFSTPPNSSDFVVRETLSKYIKIGLIPFLIENKTLDEVEISLQKKESVGEESEELVDDKWNYWVIRVRGSMELDGNENQQGYEFELGLSANRVTETRKTNFWYEESLEIQHWTYLDDNDVEQEDSFSNASRRFFHVNVFAINDHWSYGYGMEYERNDFSNYVINLRAAPAIEYSFFPYKEFNNRLVTLRYLIGLNQLNYKDTTIYNQIQELLPFHELGLDVSINQKWGNIFLGSQYQSYLHNLSFYSIRLFGGIELQLTGALSIDLFVRGGLSHDQINLVGEGKTLDEVLSQRREIASSFNFGGDVRISYRFGSKFNNFVNPRFGD